MANNNINYSSRNFLDFRTDLINYAKKYYPDIYNDLNDSSIGSLMIELNSAIGDILSHNTDNRFQETQIDYAQERRSVLSMARTFGLKIPGKRPSITIVDISVTVPVLGNSFDISYTPVIKGGSQVTGAGKIFETVEDIDFSSPFTIGGVPNRLIIPNFDSNGILINYTLVKREIVTNGFTKIFKRVISSNDMVPFLEVILPDDNVLSIDSIISLNGTNFTKNPTSEQFLNVNNKWYEVDALADDKVFIEDLNKISDNASIKPGKWISVTKKFIREYTDLGFTKITFGSGTQDISNLYNFGANSLLINKIGDFINNMSLGVTPTANTTLFVKYRVGGGSDTNIGPNVLTSTGVFNITVNGSDSAINNAVKSSLRVNNSFPALGGKDVPSVDEIRYMTKYNFSSQNRAVTIKDYKSLISLMPGKFGVPFRSGVFEEQNKVKISILGIDSNSKLTNSSTSVLRDNISTYLSNYKMFNDYIEVTNGKILNIGFEYDLYIDKNINRSEILANVVLETQNYLDINKYQMGDNIYLSSLIEIINNVGGVVNVIDIRVFNKVGQGKYSLNEVSQPYVDYTTRQIDIKDNYTLFADSDSMFEILDSSTDILIRTKN